ncbi:C40 family peptidase [Rhodospirillum centenum]|uniref:NLP/P60 family protein n=1 Tax=Rhodospirillum centenum (strain ATCC 51521 / SW) TaxID=414684 RepID=B6IPL7_RHOCS|nr:NlpC/P60 family protein [Rhodospirillum centenum]ACI99719.1 NLP/P60 family protein [Rhodospirillum centenum SW]
MTDTPPAVSPDPRIHPWRPDLAAAHLKGRVTAERFVEGVPCQIRTGFAALTETPDFDARQSSQLLFGEVFTVYEERDGWVWGQNGTDGYVGYLRLEALDAEVRTPTHTVTALRSYVYPEPDLKTPPLDLLSLGSQLSVTGQSGGGQQGGWLELATGGWIFAGHASPLSAPPADPVDTALRFLGTPYLWGGRTSLGLDCSALVQLALATAGLPCPRDSDLQAASVGALVSADGHGHAFRRGDLVFFPGHVGIMADADDLIHANAFHMEGVRESLAAVLARAGDKGITAVRRL